MYKNKMICLLEWINNINLSKFVLLLLPYWHRNFWLKVSDQTGKYSLSKKFVVDE